MSLERFSLLSRLGAAERRALDAAIEAYDVEAGTLLFDEGDPAEGLLLLAEGRVRVASRRASSAAELGPGTALGTFSLVEGGTREARAETTSRSRVLVLRRDVYEQLAHHAPRVACRLLEGILCETAALLRHQIEAESTGSVDPASATD